MKKMHATAVLVLICFFLTATQEVLAKEQKGKQSIGPGAIWEPITKVLENIHQKCADLNAPSFGECFAAAMEELGAKPEAVAFTRLTGNGAYMRDFRETGRVDVAYVEYPFRANEIQGVLLVNGFPPIIDVDNLNAVAKGQLQKDPLYIHLVKDFPEVSVWPGDRSEKDVPVIETPPGGGQRFILTYRLLNGCHACELIGSAQFAFQFDSLGNFTGIKLKGVENKVEDKKGTATDQANSQTAPIEVAVGKEFSITLESNPTTGYHWELAGQLAEAVVKLVGNEYKGPETKLIGAGGKEVWTFSAVGKGETIIKMKYVRPWEKDVPPFRTAEFKVTVK